MRDDIEMQPLVVSEDTTNTDLDDDDDESSTSNVDEPGKNSTTTSSRHKEENKSSNSTTTSDHPHAKRRIRDIVYQIGRKFSILLLLLLLFVLGWYCHVLFLGRKNSWRKRQSRPLEVTSSLQNSTGEEFRQEYGSSNHIQINDNQTQTSSSTVLPPPKHILRSYSYSNCPFTMAKFSQYELAKEGPFQSDIDRFTNSLDRAKMGLDFSNSMHAYDRVVNALENDAFHNRTIILDGDSLTRQFFIH
jgi:hypothetical protein